MWRVHPIEKELRTKFRGFGAISAATVVLTRCVADKIPHKTPNTFHETDYNDNREDIFDVTYCH